MRTSTTLRLLVVAFAALLPAACSPSYPATAEQQAPTALPLPFPSLQAPPSPTASPTAQPPSPACLEGAGTAEFGTPDFEDLPRAILDYLNAGGSPVALSDRLNSLGAAAQPVSVAIGDFTGDGRDDVAVSLVYPVEGDRLDGRMLVYTCTPGAYEITYQRFPAPGDFRGFHVWQWPDLDGDGSMDLLVSRGTCGAHTCFDELEVLSWDGAAFVNRLEGSTIELPYPLVSAHDEDGDGIYSIEVSSGGYGSAGAGPQRPVTWIWEFDRQDQRWRKTLERADPSPYRIHVLHDADDAAARAEYDFAVQLYTRVIEDDSLDDWVVADGRATLTAYARYRIAVIAAALQDVEGYESMLTEMEEAYPVGDPRHDFVEMAILFKNAFDSGGLGAACTAAAGFADSHAAAILAPLSSGVYGYANRDYTGESMCPAPEAP